MLVVLRVKEFPPVPRGDIFFRASSRFVVKDQLIVVEKRIASYIHQMKLFVCCCFQLASFLSFSQSQPAKDPQGVLFIIGGGTRSPALVEKMVSLARLRVNDYVVVLPMASAEPDSSFFYFERDLKPFCRNTISYLNFTKDRVNDKSWIDSLAGARLIFITGGDQNRFMKLVLHTPVHDAIMKAYNRGAMIAGTSAGAAVMSKEMITGNELVGDSAVSGSFKSIRYHMVELKEGLGLIQNAVIDQHFVARSRYNRLLSVLAQHPTYPCIGIDEGTAVIVQEARLTVTGTGQVIRFMLPPGTTQARGGASLVKLQNIRMDIFTTGDQFYLHQ